MSLKIKVAAGPHARQSCPVSVALDRFPAAPDRLALVCDRDGAATPCRLDPTPGGGGTLAFLVSGLEAGATAEYTLGEGAAPVTAGVELRESAPGVIDVLTGGVPFTTYRFGAEWARPFLHPVVGPYGDPVTRAYPVIPDAPDETRDHPHHKSFWVAWGDTNGEDNWSENPKGHARQIHRELLELRAGPVSGSIRVRNDWVSAAGAKMMEEERAMTFYDTPTEARFADLTVAFRATDGDVRFGDTKEGGICSIRVATSMDASGAGTIVNSYGGTNEAETWGKRAHWCDYVGPVGGHAVGIAIFDHPGNFRFPTYWHVRNYGLMTANPFGLSYFLGDKSADGSHVLAAGESLTFRYRVYVHAGDTRAAGVGEKYHDFINPPRVSVG